MLHLSERWAPRLRAQRETGMGYQLVRVTLRDGRDFRPVTVVDGVITEVAGSSEIPFSEPDIADLEVI